MTRFGLDYKYYQRIEYGEKNLSLRTLLKIARAFDMTVSDLLKFD
jgi:transcriptional regulator with XRE-family HTH domain